MRLSYYVKMLARNGFKIHPTRYPMTFAVGCSCAANSSFALLQDLLYSRKIRQTELAGPPIFVIGHWRSGTTLLHEILSQDDRFAYPSTFDCFVPNNFLVSKHFLRPLVRMLLPPKRPMDSMPTGVDLPQEDEFAICAMGAPTPYLRAAFCNHKPQHVDLLNSTDADRAKLEQLHKALSKFCKALTLKYNRPLIMKSPTHTGRIEALARWFPGAKFVHITRHPYRIFSSAMRLWKSLDQVQSYQKPSYSENWMQRFVFQCFEKMYDGYFSAANSFDSNQLIEIRYEDLMQSPIDGIKKIYSQLELPDFSVCQSKVESFLEGRSDYKPNSMQVDDDLKQQIDQRWERYFVRYGYTNDETEKLLKVPAKQPVQI